MTQEQLAEKSGVDQTTISRWEIRPPQKLDWEKVTALAKALRVKPETLFPRKAA